MRVQAASAPPASTSPVDARAGPAAESDRRRVGHVRPRRRARRAVRSAGRLGAVTAKSVAVVRVGGQPAAARRGGARRRDVQLGRAPGPGCRRVDRARSPRARSARRARDRVDLGPHVDDYEAAAARAQGCRAIASSRSRSISRARMSKRAPTCSRTRDDSDARRNPGGGRRARRRGARVREAVAERHRHRRDRRRRARRGRDRSHVGQHGDGTHDRRRHARARASVRAVAGCQGPPIKPIALRAVWEVSRAHPGVPIIGTGGVSDGRGRGRDAARRRARGRCRHRDVPRPARTLRIVDELANVVRAHDVARVRDLTGGLQ